MKWRDLDEKTILRLQTKCNKEMKSLLERYHTKDLYSKTDVVAIFRRGYSAGFLAGYEFYENKHKKTRPPRPSSTGE